MHGFLPVEEVAPDAVDRREHVGPPEVAVDTVSASPGTLVYLVGSREAALALDPTFVPVDSAIVGIVDAVNT